MEAPEQCIKSAQSQQWRQQNDINDVFLVSLLLTLNTDVSIVDLEQINASWVVRKHRG